MPALAALAVATAAIAAYAALRADESRLVELLVAGEAAALRADLERGLGERLAAVEALAERWAAEAAPRRADWEEEVRALLQRDLQIRAVLWVEPALDLRWVAPAGARLAGAPLDSAHDGRRREELRVLLAAPAAALPGATPADTAALPRAGVSRSFVVPGQARQLLACAPMRRGGRIHGYQVAALRATDVLDALAAGVVRRGYAVHVVEGSRHLFGPDPLESAEAVWGKEGEARIGDLAWRVTLWPSEELLREWRSRSPLAVLAGGLALALLVGGLVHRLAVARRRKQGPPAAAAGNDEAPGPAVTRTAAEPTPDCGPTNG